MVMGIEGVPDGANSVVFSDEQIYAANTALMEIVDIVGRELGIEWFGVSQPTYEGLSITQIQTIRDFAQTVVQNAQQNSGVTEDDQKTEYLIEPLAGQDMYLVRFIDFKDNSPDILEICVYVDQEHHLCDNIIFRDSNLDGFKTSADMVRYSTFVTDMQGDQLDADQKQTADNALLSTISLIENSISGVTETPDAGDPASTEEMRTSLEEFAGLVQRKYDSLSFGEDSDNYDMKYSLTKNIDGDDYLVEYFVNWDGTTWLKIKYSVKLLFEVGLDGFKDPIEQIIGLNGVPVPPVNADEYTDAQKNIANNELLVVVGKLKTVLKASSKTKYVINVGMLSDNVALQVENDISAAMSSIEDKGLDFKILLILSSSYDDETESEVENKQRFKTAFSVPSGQNNYNILSTYSKGTDGRNSLVRFFYHEETASKPGCKAFKDIVDSLTKDSSQEITFDEFKTEVLNLISKMETFLTSDDYNACEAEEAGEEEPEEIMGGLKLGNATYIVDSSKIENVIKSLPLAVYHYIPGGTSSLSGVAPDLRSALEKKIRSSYIMYNPFLLYHDNDPESMLHFIDILKKENSKVSNIFVVSDDDATAKEITALVKGKNIETKTIKTDIIPDLWKTIGYDTIVVVGDDIDNRGSLMGAQLASYYHAPLVMYSETGVKYDFDGKRVIIVGGTVPPNQEMDGLLDKAGTRIDLESMEKVNKHLQEQMETDYMILVNPKDVNKEYCEDFTFQSAGTVSNPYCHDSLVAPLLASVNNELMVFTDVSPVSSGLDHLDITDMVVDKDKNIYIINEDRAEGKYKLYKYEFAGSGYKTEKLISYVDFGNFIQTPDRKHLYVYGISVESLGAYLHAYEIDNDQLKEKTEAFLGDIMNVTELHGVPVLNVNSEILSVRMDNDENLYLLYNSSKIEVLKYDKKGKTFEMKYKSIINDISRYIGSSHYFSVFLSTYKNKPNLVFFTVVENSVSSLFNLEIFFGEYDEGKKTFKDPVKLDGRTAAFMAQEVIRQMDDNKKYDFYAEKIIGERKNVTDIYPDYTTKSFFYAEPYYYLWDGGDSILVTDRNIGRTLGTINDNYALQSQAHSLYKKFSDTTKKLEQNAKVVRGQVKTFLGHDEFKGMQYLTVVGGPKAIPLSVYDSSASGGLQTSYLKVNLNKPADYYYYADPDEDGISQLKVGRIFGITETDTSSFVNLITLYKIRGKMINDISLMASLTYTETEREFISFYESMKGKANVQCWTMEGEGECKAFSTSALKSNLANSDIILYTDHGETDAIGPSGADLSWADIPKMDGSLIVAPVCLTMDYYSSFKNTLFGANAIRKGAIGYMGAVSVSHANESSLGNDFVGSIISDLFGDAFLKSANSVKNRISGIPMNFMLFGDPTFTYSGTKKSSQPVDLTEAEKGKWIAFSSKTPVDIFKTCYEGETTEMDFNSYTSMVFSMNKQYGFSGISETGGKVVIAHNQIIILPDLDGNGKVQCGEKNFVESKAYTTNYDDWLSKCYSSEGSPVNLNNYLKAVVLFMNKGSSAFYGKSDWNDYLLKKVGTYYPKIYDKKTLYLPDLNGDGIVKCYSGSVPKTGTVTHPGGTGAIITNKTNLTADEEAVSELEKMYEEYKKGLAKDADPKTAYYPKAIETVRNSNVTVTGYQIRQFVIKMSGNQSVHIGPFVSAVLNKITEFTDGSPGSVNSIIDVTGWDPKNLILIGQSLESYVSLSIVGDVGEYLGYGLNGGEIYAEGKVGDKIASSAKSGRIYIDIGKSMINEDEVKYVSGKIDQSSAPSQFSVIIETLKREGNWIFADTEAWVQVWPEKSMLNLLKDYYNKFKNDPDCKDLNKNCYDKLISVFSNKQITEENIKEFLTKFDEAYVTGILWRWSNLDFLMVFMSAMFDSSVEPNFFLNFKSTNIIKINPRNKFGAFMSKRKDVYISGLKIGDDLAYQANNVDIDIEPYGGQTCEEIKSKIATGEGSPYQFVNITCSGKSIFWIEEPPFAGDLES
ncbi:MAG: hypothetical protein JW754_05300 [Candidatus Aenigmarchaeota archaeon]|nr:hypothetical protein [Candidatus Aenigmarchaeota archaeon]